MIQTIENSGFQRFPAGQKNITRFLFSKGLYLCECVRSENRNSFSTAQSSHTLNIFFLQYGRVLFGVLGIFVQIRISGPFILDEGEGRGPF